MKMKAIRVTHITGQAVNGEDIRIKLELRRNAGGELRWYDATNGEWLESHDIKSVQDALNTINAWYEGGSWQLSIGSENK